MPKISVIVPVYNTEKYLEKCISSIIKQQVDDYEVIFVNDGSTDNSEEILKKYENINLKKFRYYYKENGGLSDARNFGVKQATGDYICFIDSDDYIDENLFENLEKYINEYVDLIKYKCVRVDENYNEIEKVNGFEFETASGEEAFNKLYGKDVLLETAWLYLYKRSFWEENNFKFPIKKYHEDWALIPYVLLSAKTVISTNIYGYYYVQSVDSITRNNSEEKICRRAYDMLEHYDSLINKLEQLEVSDISKENFKIYMSNCIILKLEELPQKYHNSYIKEIKKRKILKNFKVRNLKQFVKKIVLKISVKLYLKIR